MNEHELDPIDEERLCTQLRGFPVAYQRPAGQIGIRARRIRRHRRVAVASVVAIIVAAVATPSVAILQQRQPDPAEGTHELVCHDTHTERLVNAQDAHAVTWDGWGRGISPAQVPDDVRLLWPTSMADPLEASSARDDRYAMAAYAELFAHCPGVPDESISLVWLEAGAIAKVITVERTWYEVADVAPQRVMAVDQTEVEIRDHPNGIRAVWTRGGYGWSMTGGPIDDGDLADLVRAVRYSGGEIDVRGWAAREQPTHVSRGVNEDTALATGTVRYEAVAEDVGLEVDTAPVSLWSLGFPGAPVVSVGGTPAIVVGDADWITWQPKPTVTVRLYNHAGMPLGQLLQIAEQVRPVPPGDERLVDTWGAVSLGRE